MTRVAACVLGLVTSMACGAGTRAHRGEERACLGSAPAEVVTWIRRTAIPLATVEVEQGFEDLRGLDRVIGDARVVALGEATHGSHELLLVRHRLLEYLVAERGFTVLALEADQAFWTLDTEEMLAVIEWMRRWNAAPGHEQKIQLVGFDMQDPRAAFTSLTTYLARVDPEYAKRLPSDPEHLRGEMRNLETRMSGLRAAYMARPRDLGDRST